MTYMMNALSKAQRSLPELRIAVPSWRYGDVCRGRRPRVRTRRQLEAQFRKDLLDLMKERALH